jgi:4-hydroxy-tetrahydrodipicolinate reductase
VKIAIVGYGRMGKEVEAAAVDRRFAVSGIFTGENNSGGTGLTAESLKDVDVCIEFTTPESVLGNIDSIARAGKNVVVGTTGWYDELSEVAAIVKKRNIGLLYSPNFSLGINLFYHIVGSMARLFDKVDSYDVAVSETHHAGKADSPSGTALALGAILVQNIRRKKEILHETAHAAIKPDQLHISSTRVGSVVGTHSVLFDSAADSIELVHTAKNRRGFALGALLAAEWLKGKTGVFTMKDVMSSL